MIELDSPHKSFLNLFYNIYNIYKSTSTTTIANHIKNIISLRGFLTVLFVPRVYTVRNVQSNHCVLKSLGRAKILTQAL